MEEQYAYKRIGFNLDTLEGMQVLKEFDSDEGWKAPIGWRLIKVEMPEYEFDSMNHWMTFWLERKVVQAHPYR